MRSEHLAAGCDLSWSKGIDVETMVSELRSAKGAAVERAETPVDRRPYGLANTYEAFGEATYVALTESWLMNAPVDLAELRAHVEAERWGQAQGKSHKMKGSLACLKLDCASTAAELDAALKRQVAEGGFETTVRQQLERFDAELTKIVDFLRDGS